MNPPNFKTLRLVLIGFSIVTAIAWAHAAECRATEIATEVADRAADFSLADFSAANSILDAQTVSPVALLAADEAQSPDEAAGVLRRAERDADSLGVSSLATWLPIAANLPYGDVPLVDTFVLAISALHSTDAAAAARDTFWELQELDGSTTRLDVRPLDANLREHDAFVAAEVAFVLGNVAAPEPDLVFLAFVFIQSLWGLACRPRQA
jgi:hypothetical protein